MRFITFISVFVFLSLTSYATCTSYSFLELTQGGSSTVYDSFETVVYGYPNTISTPARFSFYFQQDELCTLNYSLQFGFSEPLSPVSQELISQNNVSFTKVDFVLNSLEIEEFATGRLFYSQNNFIKELQVRPDETSPEISVRLTTPEGRLISGAVPQNSEVVFNVFVNDVVNGYGSDIDSVTVGSVVYRNGYEFNTTPSGSSTKPSSFIFSRNVSTTQSLTFEVKDNLGNSFQESVFLEVDSSKPTISSFVSNGVFYQNMRNYYSFYVQVRDPSFDSTSGPVDVRAQVSPTSLMNPSEFEADECIYIQDGQYVCHFRNNLVTALETSYVDITVIAKDVVGNEGNATFSQKELFIDTEPPVIEEFYFENHLGTRGIVSPEVNGSLLLYLKYFDDSNLDSGSGINEYFDEIQLPKPKMDSCGEQCLFWNFSTGSEDDNFGPYIDLDTANAVFRIILRDEYLRVSEGNATVLFDRFVPQILNSSVIEGDSTCVGPTIVRDSVIQTCEKFDVRVSILEEEVRFDERLEVYGNFSLVSTRDTLMTPNCSIDNEEGILSYDCVFENLEATQGYVFENYSIIVQDSAGNVEEKFFEMEILNTSYDSTDSRYDVADLKVLAPLSRVLLDTDESQGEVVAWFEGEIRDKVGKDNSNYDIVNYQIIDCNDFEIDIGGDLGSDSLMINDPSLYPVPTETIFTAENPSSGVDRDFVMSLIVMPYENPTLLNELTTTCRMALLYRDVETLYEPPQFINFSVTLEFYELPRGHLLRAHAQSLDKDLEDIEKIEDYFGGIYDTYETFAEICNVVSNVCATASSVSTGMTIISNGLFSTPPTMPFAEVVSKSDNWGMGTVQMLCVDGFVKQACDWVTCENTLLPGVKNFFEDLQFDMSFATCSILNDPSSLFGNSGASSTNLEEVPAS